jgi:hypothetical protein
MTEPSRQTIRRVEVELGANTGVAEETTAAREKACADHSNCASLAAGCHFFSPLATSYCTINADGTQFTVGARKLKKKACYMLYWEAPESL